MKWNKNVQRYSKKSGLANDITSKLNFKYYFQAILILLSSTQISGQQIEVISTTTEPAGKFENQVDFGKGVESLTFGESGDALIGKATGFNANGVYGEATNWGYGVEGFSHNSAGVIARSTSGTGIIASGPTAALFNGKVAINHKHSESPESEGLRITNTDIPGNWWNFYVDDVGGFLFLYSRENGASAVGSFADHSGTYFALSDKRKKKNILPLYNTLESLLLLNPKSYHFRSQDSSEIKSIGLIAQEVQETFPELVNYDEESDLYSLDYATLSVVAIKAIQEQNVILKKALNQIEANKNEIDDLKAIIHNYHINSSYK